MCRFYRVWIYLTYVLLEEKGINTLLSSGDLPDEILHGSTCFSWEGRHRQRGDRAGRQSTLPVMNIARLVTCDELASDPHKCGTRGYNGRAHSTPARSSEPRHDRRRRPCHRRPTTCTDQELPVIHHFNLPCSGEGEVDKHRPIDERTSLAAIATV